MASGWMKMETLQIGTRRTRSILTRDWKSKHSSINGWCTSNNLDRGKIQDHLTFTWFPENCAGIFSLYKLFYRMKNLLILLLVLAAGVLQAQPLPKDAWLW